MELNIGNKISELRRKKNATQEQLANYAGVSVAAVSKWETDNSYPDITLLPSIAEFFSVSIDALMNYSVGDGTLENLHEQLRKYDISGDFESGIPLYEEALRKYPNDVILNRDMGHLKLAQSASVTPANKETALEAITYYEKVKLLDPINKEDLDQDIAFIYGSISEYERAIHILEESKAETHELQIAGYLIKLGKYREAKIRLQSQLWSHTAFTFGMQTGYLADCFKHDGDNKTALQLCEMNAAFLEFFTLNDTPNYADNMSSCNYQQLAVEYKANGEADKMWIALSEAVRHAVRFDTNPSYNNRDVNFIQGLDGYASNNSSENACSPLLRHIECDFNAFKDDIKYTQFTEMLSKSQSDKKQKGIWE
ncbi:MAG: helix-turn-helix domain-containing protein [Eubacteriales bacterium]